MFQDQNCKLIHIYQFQDQSCKLTIIYIFQDQNLLTNTNIYISESYFPLIICSILQDQQDVIEILLNKHDAISFQRTLKGCEL